MGGGGVNCAALPTLRGGFTEQVRKEQSMATTITNQARLQFTYGTTTAVASSNIASTTLHGPLTAAKSVLENGYRADEELTYIISLTNSGTGALTSIKITDNLGAYAVTPTQSVAPLTYIGPARLYIDGVFSTSLTPTSTAAGAEFVIPSLAANANAMLIYKARVNSYARLTIGSQITNTATILATGLTEPIEIAATAPVATYADIRIYKEMSPNPVTDGGVLTSTFTIYNYGNAPATDVVMTHAFSPAPSNITVTVNGTVLSAADYSYVGGVLTLPSPASAYTLTIPAATFSQNAATGEVTINPGTVTIVVAGTL